MTKYYCDLCGREVQSVEEYVLPVLKDKEFKNRRGDLVRKTQVYTPTEMELCRNCRGIVGSFVYMINHTPAELYAGKKNNKSRMGIKE